jgi:CRP-like cAMP-binding protein
MRNQNKYSAGGAQMNKVSSFWGNIFKKKKKEEYNIYRVLKNVPLFKDLNRSELKSVERILHHREYKENETIIKEGDIGLGMYIIEYGVVYIITGAENKLLAVLSKGDFFGEIALLLEMPRTATAVAHKPTKLLGFFEPELTALLESHPKTGNKILFRLAAMIAERLRQGTLENMELRSKLEALEKKSEVEDEDE